MKRNKELQISKHLSLPSDAITRRIAWVGTIGSGKSYGAMKFAELLYWLGAQFVVLDPVGGWYGLRLAKDGKSAGISIPIFGGQHGDIPIDASQGALIADLIVDKKISAIIDVSEFEYDTDKARFADAFARRFFFRKKSNKSAVHLFLEEGQEFVPQNIEHGEEKMLHAFNRIWKIGRNYGIGGSIISQRPQEVNKKALNLSECLFAFRTSGTHERKAIEEWIKDKALDLDIANDLPKLNTGEPHIWSPSWLSISHTVKIAERWTFDSTKTPEIGEDSVVKQLTKIDIVKLSEQLKVTVEKAKANDPEELKKRINYLERQLKIPQIDDKKIREIVAAERSKLTKSIQEDFQKQIERIKLDIFPHIHQTMQILSSGLSELKKIKQPKDIQIIAPKPQSIPVHSMQVKAVQKTEAKFVEQPSWTGNVKSGDVKLIDGARRMLIAVCRFADEGLTMQQIKALARITDPSTFSRYKTTLNTEKLWEQRGNKFYPTADGLQYIGNAVGEAPTSTEDMLNIWLPMLIDGARRMLKYLISRNGEFITAEELMAGAEITDPSTYSRYKSTLVGACLVVTNGRMIAANKETLFL
jgi:hypothetical protein